MLRSYKSFIYLYGEDDLIIGTLSGPGAAVMNDWELPVIQLSFSNVSDQDLGGFVREAWTRGRNIPLWNYKDGIAKHMALRNAKTLKDLYRGARFVTVMMTLGTISASATRQYAVGSYEPLPGIKLTLPESASDLAIGQMVRCVLDLSKAGNLRK
jgi:hypothetical protein